MTDDKRVAVLIDCDNMSHRWIRAILAETAKDGTLGIKRGYGDWNDAHLEGWRDKLPKYAIQPVQQFAYTVGKNATDFSLVIDAMDLLYAGTVDTFCIVSSDSDFTRLAMRLRESGKQVHGIGARKTPEAFQRACDKFTYVEVLVEDASAEDAPEPASSPAKKAARSRTRKVTTTAETTEPTPTAATAATVATAAKVTKAATAQPAKAAEPTGPTKREQVQELTNLLLPAVEATAKEDGWATLSAVGQYVVNTNPTFDSRNYGYSKLSLLVRDVPRLEVNEVTSASGLTTLNVRAAAAKTRKRR
jgi:uncharacterized protein (TIGR00288 family)